MPLYKITHNVMGSCDIIVNQAFRVTSSQDSFLQPKEIIITRLTVTVEPPNNESFGTANCFHYLEVFFIERFKNTEV